MTRPFIALVASVIGVTLVAIAGAFVMAHQTADSAGTNPQVRALCSRSASLMTRTRMSLDIATIILRTVSACAESPYFTLSSFVTPSTSIAISSPKSAHSRSSE